MGIFELFSKQKPKMQKRSVKLMDGRAFEEMLGGGYRTLDQCPEVVSACFKISQLIASMTIYLMANTDKGDRRVNNELSRKIDISPNRNMTRSTWMSAICMNLILHGEGNSVVFPHTKNGLLDSMEIIQPHRVRFAEIVGNDDYRILIDDVSYDPQNLIHVVLNPDKQHPWKGIGLTPSLTNLADNLAQAQQTTKAFMKSKWKPSIIVKVDALTDEFSSPDGRRKLLDSYFESGNVGEPWLIPADQFSVEQIKPLSLQDLAISETVELDKRTVASVLGVPPYILGVGEFNSDEWNWFISNTIRPIAQAIEQELTRKLIISSKMYLKFNVNKLYSYDIEKISNVYKEWYTAGVFTGNEVREEFDKEPLEGLDVLVALENYIPVSELGNQKKLKGDKGNE